MTTSTNSNRTVTDSIESKMNSAAAEISEFSGKDKLGQAYKLATEGASDLAQSAKTRASEHITDGKVQSEELVNKAAEFVKEKPILALGAAAVAGWAFSKLIK